MKNNIFQFWYECGYRFETKITPDKYEHMQELNAIAQVVSGGEVGVGYCLYPANGHSIFIFKTEKEKLAFDEKILDI